MGKERATVMVCDNPRCETTTIVTDVEPFAMGFYLGKGSWHHSGGGAAIPATYACKEECIVPAIEANVARADGRDPLED